MRIVSDVNCQYIAAQVVDPLAAAPDPPLFLPPKGGDAEGGIGGSAFLSTRTRL